MISLDKSIRNIAWLAGFVYFTQGALGISAIALPLYLRSLGWGIGQIATVSSLVAFPWVIKIIYGLLSDCVPLLGYRRKSYLILFSGFASMGWLALALFPGQKLFIMIALILANLGFAATDVITDGLIAEKSSEKLCHLFQSIAWGTRSCGAIVSGFVGGWLASQWNPKSIFLLTATLPLLVIYSSFFLQEGKLENRPFQSFVEPLKSCLKNLGTNKFKPFILFIIILQIASCFGMPFFFHMREKLGFSETFLGSLMSLGWIGMVISSVIYAQWFRHFEPAKILRMAVVLSVLNIFSTLLIRNEVSALALVFFGGLCGAFTLLPITSIAAFLTHGTKIEGTLFAVLMSLYNLGQITFGFIGGKIYPYVGVHSLIIVSGLLTLSALWVIPHLYLKEQS